MAALPGYIVTGSCGFPAALNICNASIFLHSMRRQPMPSIVADDPPLFVTVMARTCAAGGCDAVPMLVMTRADTVSRASALRASPSDTSTAEKVAIPVNQIPGTSQKCRHHSPQVERADTALWRIEWSIGKDLNHAAKTAIERRH